MDCKLPPMKRMLEVDGEIIDTKRCSVFGQRRVVVMYVVNGQTYTKEERLRYKNEEVRVLGFVFNVRRPLLSARCFGERVRVHYMEGSPSSSYLPDNIHWNGLLRR